MLVFGKARKTRSMVGRLGQAMRSATSQAGLQRLVTGHRCEVQGCYRMALWLVSFESETSHWCSKHTRVFMRDVSFWERKKTNKVADQA
jgi:hypothetical protein